MKLFGIIVISLVLLSCTCNKVQKYTINNEHEQIGNGYSIFQKEIYYKESVHMLSSHMPRPVKIEANYKSFITLGNNYAKDNDHIFYKGEIIPNVDYKSFSVTTIVEEFPTLPEEDFYEFITPVQKNDQQLHPSGKMNIMPFKKRNMIIVLEYYAKDKNNVYYGFNLIPEADPETFYIHSIFFSKDKNSCYFNGNPITNSDPNTFKLIYGRWAKDNYHVYFNDQIISDNPSSFTFINNYYSKDNQSVWYNFDSLQPNSKLVTIRTSSVNDFELVSDRYAKDSENVYLNGTIIDKVDARSFQFLGDFWSKDDHHIFQFDKICEEADYDTFEVTPEGARDKNRIYDKEYRVR
jgi:hypothetical protein